MTGKLANRKRLTIRPEGAFGTASPNVADNGAGGLPLDCETISFPEGTRQLLEHQRQIGENEPTPDVIGGGIGQVTVRVALKGSSTPAGAAVNMSTVTEDAITRLLESMSQDRATTAGSAITSATTSVITAAGLTLAKNDLVLLHQAALLTPDRGNISRSASAASPYSVDPNLESVYGVTAVAYGAELYTKPAMQENLGNRLCVLVERDTIQHEIRQARPSSFKMGYSSARGIAFMDITLTGISRERTTYSALPAHAVSANSEIQGRVSQLHFGNVVHELSRVEFDAGLKQKFVLGSTGAEGYTNNIITSWTPSIKFSTLYATSWEDAVNARTFGTTMLQFGKGALENALINTLAVFFEKGQVGPAPDEDDDDTWRNAVTIMAKSPEYPTDLQVATAERGELFVIGRW